jgi:sulfur carrier protein
LTVFAGRPKLANGKWLNNLSTAIDLFMEIQVNGEPQIVPEYASVAWLIAHLKLEPKFVAVERNRELIPRANHAECTLQAGDEIEIVTLVGGG